MTDFFQDIKPLTKVGSRKKISEERVVQDEPIPEQSSFNHDGRKHGPTGVIWILVIVAFVVLGFSISFIFSKAEVKITPKSLSNTLDETITFQKSQGTPIPFEVMSLDGSVDKQITSAKSETVQVKAQGTIVIYNAYSTSPQKLIASTRFQTSNGNIYRLQNAVVVPGGKFINGKITPGSVEAIIIADKPGDQYNSGMTDFTIPGFKGLPQYDKFYARSKTEITGGRVGVYYTIDQATFTTEKATLQDTLLKKLRKETAAQIPSGYVTVAGAESLQVPDVSDGAYSKDQTFTFSLKGRLTTILFKESDLSKLIVAKMIPDMDSANGAKISTMSEVAADVVSPATFTSSDDLSSLTLKLSGSPKVIWSVDTDAIKKALAGKTKGNFENVLAQFATSVDKAELVLKPFWIRTIPAHVDKIKVTINKP